MKRIIRMMLPLSVLLVAGCTEDKIETGTADSISLSVETLSFGPDGGSEDIVVTSSGDWRISGKPVDWMSLSADGGKDGESVTVKVEKNSTMETKTAELKIFSGSATKAVTVTSAPAYVIEFVDGAVAAVSSEGGDVSILVNTNVPELDVQFSGDGSEWVEYKGRNDVFGKTYLLFSVSESDRYLLRSTDVTVQGSGETSVLKLTQAQLDAILPEKEYIATDLTEQNVTLTVKHNVEIDELELPSWISISDIETQPAGEDGLMSTEYTLHLNKALATRLSDISFDWNNETMAEVTIRQQNPDPVLTDIQDENLRTELSNLGWIIPEEGSTECEILEPGLTSTSLELENTSWSGGYIGTLNGLGAFRSLTEISLSGYSLEVLDISDCTGITSLGLYNITSLSEVRLGDNPLTEFSITGDYYTLYLENESLIISGKNVKTVNINSDSSYLSYYDGLASIDVTGCPVLEELHAKRETEEYDYWTGDYTLVCNLETVYVSAEQQASIDAGTLTVEKSDLTQIVVK